MDAAKTDKASTPDGPKPRLRDVAGSVLLLIAIIFFAYHAGTPTSRTTSPPGHAAPDVLDASHAANVGVSPARIEQTEDQCLKALRDSGIAYRTISHAAVSDIAWPIALTGPIAGIRIHGTGKPDDPTNYLDCRLAIALLAWAPQLRAKGVVGVEHYSMYRADAVVGQSKKPSGHATGRAIDVAKLELRDGRILNVLDDWKNRTRGADPCHAYPDEQAGKLLRELVCDVAARGLFQTIVTPHYNDAHGNHVHLEMDPQGGELWIR
jgi:hypothetical protein